MPKSSSPFRRILLPPAIVIAIAVAGVSLAGQAPTSLPDLVGQVLTAVGILQTDVNDLQTTVGEIQEAVTALGAPIESNMRATAKVFFRAGVMDCTATNVSAVARHVGIAMINSGTGALITQDGGTIATGPGQSRSVGVLSSAFTGSAHCLFTVLDDGGTRADIRANLVIGAILANDTTLVSVSAE